MRSRGLLPIVYHFLKRNDPVSDQVENYLDSADDGAPFIVMLDIETAGDGTNPTVAQADAFYDGVHARTGKPRSQFLTYMPRWWYLAFGNGDRSLADTILYNSHFTVSPNLTGFAGDKIEIIQYSSTAPIAGLASPGTGDMNIAINHTIESFLGLVKGTGGSEMASADVDLILARIQVIRDKVEGIYNHLNIQHGEDIRNVDAESAQIDAKLETIDTALETLSEKVSALETPVVQIDAAAVADALKPLLGGLIEAAVDAQLDQRNISLRTE
jgi:hypothetical protein